MDAKGARTAIRRNKRLRMPNENHMQCDICEEDMKSRKATSETPYHYDLSGLENVFLVGITVYTCQHCDIKIPEIPRVTELNQTIAETLANKPTLLTGPEIRFLRNRAGFSAKKFAALLNVTSEHLSRIENNNSQGIGGAADKLARVATVDGEQVREFLSRLSEMHLGKDKETAAPEVVKFSGKTKWKKMEGEVAA